MEAKTIPLPDDASMAPAALAEAFAQAVKELKEEGKLVSPEGIAFADAGVLLLRQIAATEQSKMFPPVACGLMERVSLAIVAASGLSEGLFCAEAKTTH